MSNGAAVDALVDVAVVGFTAGVAGQTLKGFAPKKKKKKKNNNNFFN